MMPSVGMHPVKQTPAEDRKSPGPRDRVLALMRQAGASGDVETFMRSVSNAFHEVQAGSYDDLVGPQIQSEVIPLLGRLFENIEVAHGTTVLDLGCGTGFAGEALLGLWGDRVGRLHCADISAAMLERCRARFATHTGEQEITFATESVGELTGRGASFDVVVTSSFLHHILDLESFFAELGRVVRDGGYYVALHEPSSRFGHNGECARLGDRYRRSLRWRRMLRPSRWYGRMQRVAGERSAATKINDLLLERRVTAHPLTWLQLASLVDIHDPAVPSEVRIGEAGFDPESFVRAWPGFRPVQWKSYGFLGDVDASGANSHWKQRAAILAARYPQDGANFAAVWQRETGNDGGLLARRP